MLFTIVATDIVTGFEYVYTTDNKANADKRFALLSTIVGEAYSALSYTIVAA